MQSKISSFFKPSTSAAATTTTPAPAPPSPLTDGDGDEILSQWEDTQHQFRYTYKRRPTNPQHRETSSELDGGIMRNAMVKSGNKDACLNPEPASSHSKVLNKKRSYAQVYLEFGQSDFNQRTCSTCGIMYTPGDEGDEKEHKAFHRNYLHGIPFKGWQNEKVVHIPCTGEGRIVLVSERDLSVHRNKVQDVINMMEIELGNGWIFHKLCKVYLFILSNRVAGCLVAEQIKEAHKALNCSTDQRQNNASRKRTRANPTPLKFGNTILLREPSKKIPTISSEIADMNDNGAIFCEEEAWPAVCGIRAIWVAPSNRRKHIASELLDAARKSVCMRVLERSQLAFSPPTSTGKSLACNYVGSASFLVYKPQPVDSSML